MSGPTLAIVPLKPLGEALGRLSGVLEPAARRDLQVAMLADVLEACGRARGVGEALVVTADPEAAGLARAWGARVVADHDPPRGMNPAVARGLTYAEAAGAGAALVVTADVPLAGPGDLEALLRDAPDPPSAVLAPSRDGTGTNALLVAPPTALAPRLGPGSLARHLALAARRGLRARVLERPGLALDIDTPDDLAALWVSGAPCAARAVCARLALAERLAAAAR